MRDDEGRHCYRLHSFLSTKFSIQSFRSLSDRRQVTGAEAAAQHSIFRCSQSANMKNRRLDAYGCHSTRDRTHNPIGRIQYPLNATRTRFGSLMQLIYFSVKELVARDIESHRAHVKHVFVFAARRRVQYYFTCAADCSHIPFDG